MTRCDRTDRKGGEVVFTYYRKRKCLMKKKHKLCTLLRFRGSDLSVKTVKAVESKIKGIDNDICKSHIKERECNEVRAVTRVKEDPKYFFRYAKKFKRTSENIGPLLNGDGKLTNDIQEISHNLSNQFCSTFSTPRLEEVICDPITFFDTDKRFWFFSIMKC